MHGGIHPHTAHGRAAARPTNFRSARRSLTRAISWELASEVRSVPRVYTLLPHPSCAVLCCVPCDDVDAGVLAPSPHHLSPSLLNFDAGPRALCVKRQSLSDAARWLVPCLNPSAPKPILPSTLTPSQRPESPRARNHLHTPTYVSQPTASPPTRWCNSCTGCITKLRRRGTICATDPELDLHRIAPSAPAQLAPSLTSPLPRAIAVPRLR
ncbi:hypothetical protein PSPO01_07533 [Paraphaeosphaeria sporulosa]